MAYIIYFFQECSYVVPIFDLQPMCFLHYILLRPKFKVAYSMLAVFRVSLRHLQMSQTQVFHWFFPDARYFLPLLLKKVFTYK